MSDRDKCPKCGEEIQHHNGHTWHKSNWHGPMRHDIIHCLERQLSAANATADGLRKLCDELTKERNRAASMFSKSEAANMRLVKENGSLLFFIHGSDNERTKKFFALQVERDAAVERADKLSLLLDQTNTRCAELDEEVVSHAAEVKAMRERAEEAEAELAAAVKLVDAAAERATRAEELLFAFEATRTPRNPVHERPLAELARLRAVVEKLQSENAALQIGTACDVDVLEGIPAAIRSIDADLADYGIGFDRHARQMLETMKKAVEHRNAVRKAAKEAGK